MARDDLSISASVSPVQLEGRLVAEGIETDEQWEQLLRMGCNVGQGYRFAKPVDPSELSRLAAGPLALPLNRLNRSAHRPVPAR